MKTPHCHTDRPYYAKGMCRSCYEKSLRVLNPEFVARQQDNSRRWAKNHADKKRSLDVRYATNPANRDRRSLVSRRSALAVFGLTLDDELSLLESQGGVCAICGRPPGGRWFHIDHDHSTGRFRGLLCGKCNKGLGLLGDSLASLQLAINYLSSQHI